MNNHSDKPMLKILVIYLLFILVLITIGCNPVKRVINDKRMLDEVAVEVIRKGYCVNDTLIIQKSDTTISYDTLTNTVRTTFVQNDTVYLWEIKYRDITKKIYIRDTVTNTVTDKSRIGLLEQDVRNALSKYEEQKQKSRKRMIYIIFLSGIIALGIYLKLKP